MNTRSEPLCKRAHERVRVTWPVKLGALRGWTRDVSAGGICFELEGELGARGDISFEVELDSTLGHMELQCCGRIVRLVRSSGRTGVAVRMTDAQLASTPQTSFSTRPTHGHSS